jgi:hypothetical protein
METFQVKVTENRNETFAAWREKGVGVTFVAERMVSKRQLPEGFPLALFASV